MNRFLLALASVLFMHVLVYAQPPEPPTGKRWILNETFSDEFNGTELDLSKWYNYHPSWKGREPGLFLPSQVKVENGYMSIRGEKMDRDTVIVNWDGSKSTYNIKAGAVVSRSTDAWFGYYECRFKAAKTTMSTTFWLSTRNSYPGPGACNDRYGLEWDVQECIGREGNFDGSWFAKGMHSNSHFWYTDCDGEKHDYRAASVDFESDDLASDTFHVYGGWWKNESRASYYYNKNEVKSHSFFTGVKEKPFDQPMGVNLVSETYPFPWISLPTDEELADSSKNICYYDWVRAYSLVDVDELPDRENSLLQNGGFESGDFSYWSGWGGHPREVVSEQVFEGNYAAHLVGPGAPEYVVNLRAFSTYELSCYGKIAPGSGPISFGIKDPSEQVLGSVQVTETSYTRKSFQFSTGSSGAQLKFYFYAQNAGDEGYADDFELVPLNPDTDPPQETVMFNEHISIHDTIREKTARQSMEFLISYMANANREIHLRLFNRNQMLVGEQSYPALAGYGKKYCILQLDSLPASAMDYQLIADIRPIDSTIEDTFQTAAFTFNLLDPVDLGLRILDLRDASPIEGALVTIGDSVKTTDGSGEAYFRKLSVGLLHVQVEKEGFLSHQSEDMILRKDTGISISMIPVSHTLSVYVQNAHTGDPLSGARVSMGDTQLESDHNGKANFTLYAGLYPVSIRLDRYADVEFSIDVRTDSTLHVELNQLLADVKFVLKLDNSSLAGATVLLDGRSALTSPIGMANFSDLKTDTTYMYSIQHQSELWREDTVTFQTDTTLRIYFYTENSSGPSGPDGLRLYPNPAGTTLQVKGLEEQTSVLQVLDMQGRVLLEFTGPTASAYDISTLPSGTYLLKLLGSDYPKTSLFIKN